MGFGDIPATHPDLRSELTAEVLVPIESDTGPCQGPTALGEKSRIIGSTLPTALSSSLSTTSHIVTDIADDAVVKAPRSSGRAQGPSAKRAGRGCRSPVLLK